jgi:hypothetical protein
MLFRVKLKAPAAMTAMILLAVRAGWVWHPALAAPTPPASQSFGITPPAVYAKVIYLLKDPPREKDRPEAWIARALTAEGRTHFMAVSGWVPLGGLEAKKPTVVWNGASDWIDDGQRVQACPGWAKITKRGSDVTVEMDAFMPIVNQVRLQVPDKLGAQTLTMVVKDRIYVALQVGQPPEPPATQPAEAPPEGRSQTRSN